MKAPSSVRESLRIMLVFCILIFIPNLSFSQSPEEKIEQLGIILPEPDVPMANYVKYTQVGNLVFLAGHGPCGGEFKRGKVSQDLTIEEAYSAARLTGVCLLASLKQAVGDLSRVKRIVRVFGMVNAPADFTDHPKVINGCSDLMTEVFGENGKHARAAVGMSSLPSNIPVEIEMIVELTAD